MMGGQIKASSRLGQGTQFTIRVPAIVSTEEIAEPEAPVVAVEAPARATVLSIDDDAGARDLLSRFLTKEGFRVVAVGSGREGLRMAKEMHPDVITLDVMMPGMDGWAVLSTLKADPEVADIPVVVITMMDSRNIGYALGASEYLTKPLTKERVVSVVRKLIKSPTVLVVDDDADIRALIARFLQGEACKVLQAANGQAALDLMRDEVPGLILLDLMMPEMDGFTFVEEIRRRPDWGGIPIIVITALDLSAEDRSRLNGGVYKILQKGAYTRDELLRTVGALVSGWVTPNPTPAAEAK